MQEEGELRGIEEGEWNAGKTSFSRTRCLDHPRKSVPSVFIRVPFPLDDAH
jgi:hypothetical protein